MPNKLNDLLNKLQRTQAEIQAAKQLHSELHKELMAALKFGTRINIPTAKVPYRCKPAGYALEYIDAVIIGAANPNKPVNDIDIVAAEAIVAIRGSYEAMTIRLVDISPGWIDQEPEVRACFWKQVYDGDIAYFYTECGYDLSSEIAEHEPEYCPRCGGVINMDSWLFETKGVQKC